MTNADHIRAMTDEEMAELFYFCDCPRKIRGCPTGCEDCKVCWLEWLKQPYEEADE